MAFTDTFKAIPDQFLDALDVTQQLILSNASAFVESARSFTPATETIPFTDRLPDPVAVSDGVFGFAEKVLASQRDFTHKLLEIYAPPKAADKAPAAAKAATKSV
jgi:hypothetical protein